MPTHKNPSAGLKPGLVSHFRKTNPGEIINIRSSKIARKHIHNSFCRISYQKGVRERDATRAVLTPGTFLLMGTVEDIGFYVPVPSFARVHSSFCPLVAPRVESGMKPILNTLVCLFLNIEDERLLSSLRGETASAPRRV